MTNLFNFLDFGSFVQPSLDNTEKEREREREEKERERERERERKMVLFSGLHRIRGCLTLLRFAVP